MAYVMAVTDGAIKALIYKSCLLLDAEDYAGYLALCAPQFTYKITVFSRELRKTMTWMNHKRKEMMDLFDMLPKHVKMPGEFTRQATVYVVERDDKSSHARVTTALVVIYTDLNGFSSVFAVGQYHDTIDISAEVPLLVAREVVLKTRDLSPGSHIPI